MGFPVRNLKNIGGFPIHVFIPPVFNPIYKVEVVTATETIDITLDLIEGEYTDGITETIGNFNMIFDNAAQQYSGRIALYDKVKIYLDYGSEATTLVFTGMIERPSYSDSRLILTGRSSASRTLGKLVTYSATNVARSEILKAIVLKYFNGIITTTNVTDDAGLATVNYADKPFWECVQELCSAGSYDAYIDSNFDLHYFESGSIINETEAVAHDYNLLETGDFSPDMQSIVNRVRVYGANTDGIQILSTAEDLDSQSLYDIRELKIDDTSITTETEANDRAAFELSKNLTPSIVGTVKSLLLPTLRPGEKVRISDGMNGLEPSQEGYAIQKFTHKFSNDEPPQTELTVQKERSSIPQILKKRIRFEYTISSSDNPNEMEFSRVYNFDTDSGTHTNTKIEAGSLISTDTSGNWISPSNPVGTDFTIFETRLEGNNLGSAKTFISRDGGTTFTYLPLNTPVTLGSGTSMIIKVIFEAIDVEVKTLGVYYK